MYPRLLRMLLKALEGQHRTHPLLYVPVSAAPKGVVLPSPPTHTPPRVHLSPRKDPHPHPQHCPHLRLPSG